jgi:hypothetical protein
MIAKPVPDEIAEYSVFFVGLAENYVINPAEFAGDRQFMPR